MATATYLSGAKTPYHFSLRSFCSQQPLKFASFGGACRRLQAPTSGGRRGLKVVCNVKNLDVLTRSEPQSQALEELSKQLSCVMKFGGSSVASAERMKEVADLILSFPEERPVIVLFAMGKTTNKLLVAGEKSASCVSTVSEIDELSFVKELHHRTVDELGLEQTLITDSSLTGLAFERDD